MDTPDWKPVLDEAHSAALSWLESLPARRVMSLAEPPALLAALGTELADRGVDAEQVIRDLTAALDPGLAAMPSGRFFGWVIGGNLPVSIAADWLVSAWDQNAGMFESSPGAAVLEQVTGEWVKDLLGLPMQSSVGFVTGAQVANFVCLAAARNAVLERVGWDVEADGLQGAPRVNVVVGGQVHGTVRKALRLLGLGERTAHVVPADAEGRMIPDALADVLAGVEGPAIVSTQAGEVNSGAFDDFEAIADVCTDRQAWMHVDGAFGLWAAASPSLAHLTAAVHRADSWCTDGHKTLSTPYDCGIAIVADRAAHKRSMGMRAEYLPADVDDSRRSPVDWNPELSRRFRSFPIHAALRHLGRDGVADLVARLCRLAGEFASQLSTIGGVRVLNEVVFNQVLVRFGDDDDHTRAVLAGVREDGTCFMSGTTWHDQAAMRISVSNFTTDSEDVATSVATIARIHEAITFG